MIADPGEKGASFWQLTTYWLLLILVLLLSITTAIGIGAKGVSNPVLALFSVLAASPIIFFGVRVLPEEVRRARRFEALMFYCVFFVVGAIVAPIIAASRPVATRSTCLLNLKQLALGHIMYASDYDERFPIAGQWSDLIYPYTKKMEILKCSDAKTPESYAMNDAVSSFSTEKLSSPDQTVLLFEADAYLTNASGGREWFVRRHNDTGSVAYTDGHVKRINAFSTPTLNWRP